MGELQCTLEFSIELHKFINVDLFQRGFYQIRSTLKTSQKLPVKIEVNLPKNSFCSLVFPACIVNGTAVSKTFQILYKNEEITLDDIIIFKVHSLIEGHKVRETILKADFQINVELWFTDQSFGPDHHNSIHCVSTRTLLLHFDPARGLHHHIPLLFDYFHLCAVTITIHASIIAMCQPYLRKGVLIKSHQTSLQKPLKQTFLTGSPRLTSRKSHFGMETVYFGQQTGRSISSSTRLYRAYLVHWELCTILLSAHFSLCRKSLEYISLLPSWQQLKLDSLESVSQLDGISDFAKECYKHVKSGLLPSKEIIFGPYEGMEREDEFLLNVNKDIPQICGALILLWQKFLDIVIGREKVRQHLSRQRHFQRIKRFAEGFFIIERTRDSVLTPCDSSVEIYQEVSDQLRKSSYLNLLPPLEVECVEFDGDLNSLPILYEEHYQETARRDSGNSQSSYSDSSASLNDVNFIVEDYSNESNEGVRRTSQGSLGQKYRSPDISATPTSPSAYSWCPESITKPLSVKASYLISKKQSLKDKIFHSKDLEDESKNQSTSNAIRLNQKIAIHPKMKLRSRTVNFLRQLKKPQLSQRSSSVVLLGVKKLDTLHTANYEITKSSRIPFALESGIRHSQSTLSVMSSLFTEGNSAIPNSESMPDLTSGCIPPPPPPPSWIQKSCFQNGNFESTSSESTVLGEKKIPFSSSFLLPERKGNEILCISPSHIHKSHKISSMDSDITKGSNINIFFENGVTDNFYSTINYKIPSEESYKSFQKCQGNKQPQQVVSNQPSKSKTENIFNSSQKKRNIKHDPPPPLSITSEECSSGTSDIASNSNVCEICPPSPPVQFKDPPQIGNQDEIGFVKPEKLSKHKKHTKEIVSKSSSSWSNDSCLNSLICQGTLFFPKPPAQFGDEVIEQSNKDNESKSLVTNDISFIEKDNNDQEIKIYEKVSKELAEENEKKVENMSFSDSKCTILEMLSDISELDTYIPEDIEKVTVSDSYVNERQRRYSLITSNSYEEDTPSFRRASVIGQEMISFVKAKEEFRKHLQYPWLWYSDFPSLASDVPYFQCDSDLRAFSPEGMHLVICVHGLDGNSADLRLVRTYLELGLPTVNFEFLMSERNQGETFDDFDTMTDRLVSEISYYIEVYGLKPVKISFIGHSLGNIIIRSALTRPEMKPYLSKLHTFLSLSGPHLGTLYNSSGLINMGMWFMQKWKKSGSLLQLAMKDSSDLRQTFLYKLSQKSGLEHFRNILLFGSSQDRYVPLHSARIELCKPALKDTSFQGMVYREMVTNLMQPIIQSPDIALLRYDVHHALPSSANSLIGRAAHIAVLDSELFIEKFLAVCGLRFFI